MKKIRILLVMLIVTFALSVTAMYAGSLDPFTGYTGIELKARNGWTFVEAKYKLDGSKEQSYYNAGNINQCTSNENGVDVKLYYIPKYTSTIEIPKANKTVTWNNDETTLVAHSYTPYIKNHTYSFCKSVHSGIWYHN